MRTSHNQIKYGAIIGYVVLVLNSILGIILTPFLVSFMGKSEYGLYQLMGAFVGTMSILDFGLGQTVVRYVAQYRINNEQEQEQKLLSLINILYYGISILVVLLAIPIYTNLNYIFPKLTSTESVEIKYIFIILIMNLVLSLPGGIFSALIKAYEEFMFIKGVQLIRIIVRVVLIYSIIASLKTALSLVILDTVLNISIIICNYVFCRKKLQIKLIYDTKIFSKIEKSFLKEILVYSFFVFLDLIVNQILWQVDSTIIGMRLNTSSVTIYGVGMNFSQFFHQSSLIINSVILPYTIRLVKNNPKVEALNKFMFKMSRIQGGLTSFILSAFFIFGRQFTELWMGKGYYKAWISALLVMVGFTPALIENAGVSILRAKNKLWVYTTTYLIVFAINIIATYLVIPVFGITGAAFMTMISLWVGNLFILNPYYSHKLKLKIGNLYIYLFKTIFPITGLVMLIFKVMLHYFPIKTWYEFGGFTALYTFIFAVFIWKIALNKTEREQLLRTIRKENDR